MSTTSQRSLRRWLWPALFAVAALSASAAVSYFGQAHIQKNQLALSMLVTSFTVLAGFQISVLGILGDPALLPQGTNWRDAQLAKPELVRQIDAHFLLLSAFVATLLLVLGSVVAEPQSIARRVVEHVYLFMGSAAAFYSMRLPWILREVQVRRLEAAITERKREHRDPRLLEFKPYEGKARAAR
ncbi:MAG: hypothetical protein AAFX50_22935 [Acidobacteriota bacterium]